LALKVHYESINCMQNKLYITVFIVLIFWIEGCVAPPKKSVFSKEELLFNSDSLLSLYPNDNELLETILSEKIDHAIKNNDMSMYKEILVIDPKNPLANYHLLMDEGLKSHKKDYKNGQWDAIQSFSRASTYIDTLGEPYYWMGKAYEKKDEMDFELPLESYNKSLELYLTDDMRLKANQSISVLMKRKKTYEDFWK
tara:strand:- start:51 stop:641 length:591 start_codon:yes stop_codon:yes gene_type:complete